MDNVLNTIQNKALATLTASAPQGVVNAIRKASSATGVDFAYLVQQAGAESSFNPKARAKTSSASGLYQFIESTWMSMVKNHGEKYGIETEGKSRSQILALRQDPEVASFMAAEFASENEKFLNQNWGGKVGSTELYFAHFLGAGQAAAFLKARDENPLEQAALLFPKAAKANRNVFYDTKTGRPKTMDEVYAFFDNKFDIKDAGIPDLVSPPPRKPEQDIVSSVFISGHNRPSYNSLNTYNSIFTQNLVSNPVEILLLSQLDMPMGHGGNGRYNQ